MTVQFKEVYRVTTFVPHASLENVLGGIQKVTSLRHGNYDHVAWWIRDAVEQYRPLPGSNPTSGKEGVISRGESVRLEIEIPRDQALLAQVLCEGLIPSHPWEEPAIFVDESITTVSKST